MKSALALMGLVLLGGCKDDKKPPPPPPKAPEAIPSDFVVNSFLDNGPTDIKVRSDGGVALPLEGGAPSPGGDTAAAAAAAGAPGVKVLEPGEEPRAPRKYELKQGRTESLKVTVTSTVSQEVQGQPAQGGAQPGMAFVFALTPGAKDADGDTNVKVAFTKVDAQIPPDVDPSQAKQLAQAFKVLNGQVATFQLSPKGAVSGFAMQDERLARSELSQIAQQPFEGMFVVLPGEPIGKGAKWEDVSTSRQEGLQATTTSTYTLKEIAPDGLVVSFTTTRKAAPQPYPDPRAPKGTTMAVDGLATGTIKVRLDRVPAKGQVDSNTSITLTQPGGPGAKAKVVVQKVGVKQNIEAQTP